MQLRRPAEKSYPCCKLCLRACVPCGVGVDTPSNGGQPKRASSEEESGNGSIGGFGLPTVLSVDSPWRNWLQEQESLPAQRTMSATVRKAGAAADPQPSKDAQSNSAVGAIQSDEGCEEAVGVSMGGDDPDEGTRRSEMRHLPGPVGEGIEDPCFDQVAYSPNTPPTGTLRIVLCAAVLLHCEVLFGVPTSTWNVPVSKDAPTSITPFIYESM